MIANEALDDFNRRELRREDYNDQRKLGRILSIFSAGVINCNGCSIVIKDPITGIKDLISESYDRLRYDSLKGVWLGRRPINNCFGIDSGFLRCLNLAIMHQAVRIDGKCYHLNPYIHDKKTVKQNGTQYQVDELDEEWSNFEWVYKGRTKNNIHPLLNELNRRQSQNEYSILLQNCQDVAEAVFKYAVGQYDIPGALYFIKSNQCSKLCERFASGARVYCRQ